MRILITGGNGQLGRALQAAFAADDVEALGHAELDITNREQVSRTLARIEPDVVVHAAAWTDTAGCERDPDLAMRVNGEGAAIVAEACRESGAAMVYISSNEVFDGEKQTPYPGGRPAEPDQLLRLAPSSKASDGCRRSLDRSCIVRTSWLYGPGRESFPEKILGPARQGRPAEGRDGRDRLRPRSPSTWRRAIAGLVHERASGIFHLTNAGACSRWEWAEEVLRLAGIDLPIEPATQADYGAPYRKPVYSVLANTNAARLGITLRPWQEALAEHMHTDRRSGSGPMMDRPTGDEMSASAPAYAPARRVEPPKASRRPA